MFQAAFKNRKLWGWIVLLTGVIFFLQVPLKILPMGLWEWLWPILIIVAGTQLMNAERD